MRTTARMPVLVLLFALAAQRVEESKKEAIQLPGPEGLEMTLGDALRARSSTRAFDSERKLTRAQLGTILWAASGITRPDSSHPQGGKRTSPAAFESYAVDVHVTSGEGTFVYSPKDHALVPHATLGKKDLRAEIPRSDWVKEAPVLVMLVANLDRYPAQVRAERRRDYSHADAAVIGENIYLAAAALKLGTCLTADAKPEAGSTLGLGESQKVVFILPLGFAKAKAGE